MFAIALHIKLFIVHLNVVWLSWILICLWVLRIIIQMILLQLDVPLSDLQPIL